MKKIIKLVIVFLILFIVLEFIFFLFKTNHKVTYEINNNKQNYKITETYQDKIYYLKIVTKNNTYSLEIPNNFHKRKKIVKDIYSYKKDDVYCIYPALKNKDNNSNIICSKNSKTSSYYKNKKILTSFVKKLKENGYSSISWEKQSNKKQKEETLTIYPNSINDNTYIYLYKYNGFYQVTNKNIKTVNLFKNDSYNNSLGFVIDKYYIIPDYDEKYEYTKFYRIDMTKNKIKTIKLKKSISKDSYLNGIIDNEAYIFDRDELIQYKLNPKKKKVQEVGNKEDKVLNYNLKFTKTDAYTLRDNDVKFKTIDDYIKKIENNTKIKYIKKYKNSYYYQKENNNVYYVNNINKTKVLLFKKEISDFKLIKDTIYFISDNTLYSYSFKEGLKKIMIYNELSFNPENRIAIYIK